MSANTNNTGKRIPELLAPAGNFERLRVALHFGADAVYLGMRRMSLRNFADNFSLDELYDACNLAHEQGKRIYVAINAFVRDNAFSDLSKFLADIAAAGADAFILSDPGVLMTAREAAPHMELHLSTQMNTLNSKAAAFWHAQGISRIVLARELTLPEAQQMVQNAPQGLAYELFVHGAMCISYSGRCLLSNYMSGRDSSLGECVQPCRWRYDFREAGKKDYWYGIEEDEHGSYLLNSRDLNLLPHLREVCDTGVCRLKIEGRMKSINYVAGVVNAYRMALDAIACGKQADSAALEKELLKVSHRPYTIGFFDGEPGAGGQAYESAQYQQTHELAAVVLEVADGRVLLEQRNRFFLGDELDILSPKDIGRTLRVLSIENEEGTPVTSAPHPKERLWLQVNEAVHAGDLLRRSVDRLPD